MTASSTFKDLLLRKLYHSVICSVLSQLIILQLYVFVSKFNITHPIDWFLTTFRVFASFNTWILTLAFLAIVFAQSIVCAKDYVFRTSYRSTRFRKLLSAFSVHNFLILVLNVLAGVTLTWLLSHLAGGDPLVKECRKGSKICLNKNTFYVLTSGLWNGFYYFSKVHVSHKHLDFPVVHQRKLLQFKARVVPLLKESLSMFITPMLYYMLIFYLWGDSLFNNFRHLFGLEDESTSHLAAYIHLYIFGTIYCFNMNLMRFFFNLFLTEPVEFPLVKQQDVSPCLQTSMNMSDLPIVQHLACMDLYNLAQWSKPRRKVFFSLSHLGGHPYNWNSLVESLLKLFATHIEMLGKPTEIKVPPPPEVVPQVQSPYKFHNLRNMTLVPEEGIADIVKINYASPSILSFPKFLFDKLIEKLNKTISILKVLLGINYFFGELPQANVQKFLSDGYVIIWSSQGISNIICTSLQEDQYGIILKDLPAVVTTLVHLKLQLDKLNKVPALTRRIIGGEDFYFKMMGAITAAVKRSLFNICRNFNKYLQEIPLSHQVVEQLQSVYKNN